VETCKKRSDIFSVSTRLSCLNAVHLVFFHFRHRNLFNQVLFPVLYEKDCVGGFVIVGAFCCGSA